MKSCYGFDLDTQEELSYTFPIDKQCLIIINTPLHQRHVTITQCSKKRFPGTARSLERRECLFSSLKLG